MKIRSITITILVLFVLIGCPTPITEPTDADLVATAKTALNIGYADGDDIDGVTQTVTLPATVDSAPGVTITWSSDNTAVITAAGAVTRPASASGDATVVLTATITKGLENDTKKFSLTVLKEETTGPTDADLVATAKTALAIIYGSGDSNIGVTQDLTLPTTVTTAPGVTITWSSDNTAIDAATGAVTRPFNGTGNAAVLLTANISKGSESDIKDFNLTVLEEGATGPTDAQLVAAAKAALAIGYGGSDNANSVTQDLTLPATGDGGTTIEWSSDNTAIDAATGAVTRPSASSSDASVTLTATITKESATDTKTFVLTVPKEEPTDIGTLGDFTIDVDNKTAETHTTGSHSVTVNGGLSPGNDYTLSITDPLSITNAGAISIPNTYASSDTYTITVTAVGIGNYSGTKEKTFTLTVVLSDADAVADALSTLDITAAVGGNLQAVTSSFTLPTAGEEGTSISWEVLSGSAITLSGSNNENAAVTRPSFTAADDDVLIKATVTKNGETDTKTFSLKVLKASNLSDAESVAQAKADLDITELGFVSGDSYDSVTQDFTLPTTGSEGTTISWEVVSGSAIDLSGSNNKDAAVTRPSFTATDDDVVLKATFTKNGETDSNTFNLKVLKADSLSDTESVTQAKDDLDIAGLGFALGDTFDSVTQDFTLPTTGSEGTTISWEVVSGSGISLSGSSNKDASVSRPDYTDGDSNVKLRATYSKNGATASEEFDLTVLKKDQIPLTASLTGSISPITIPAGSDSTKTLSFTGASQSLIIGTDIEVRIKTRPNTAAEAHLSMGVNTGVLFPSTDIIPRDGGDYTIELSGIGNYTGTLDRTLNLTVTALAINSITYTAINTETSTALTAAAVPTVDPAEAATGALFDIDTGFTSETGLSFNTGTGAISGTASAVIDKSYTVSITGGDATKYEGSTQSTSIQVKVTLSDADAVANALSALDITTTVGGNLQAVTGSFALPATGEEGTSISWEVVSGSAIDLSGTNNENAAVTRPSFTATDDDVVIKATVTKNGETDTKTFSLKVLKASNLSDAESVAQAKADLDTASFGFASGDAFDSITQDFTLPTIGSDGVSISWNVVSGSAIDLSGTNNKDAAVTRPSFTATDDDVLIEATFTKNGETDTKTFNLKVLKASSLSDTESVNQAKDDLDIAGLGFASGDTFDSVTQDFTLPTTGSEGTTISWEVVSGSGISLSGSSNKDASLSRPDYTDGDSNVKLRATYSKNGATASEEFDLTVLKKDQVPLTASLTGSISPITIPAGSDSTKTLSFTGASQSLIIGTDIEVRIKTRPNTAAEAHLSMGVNTGVLFPSTDIIPRDGGDYTIELSGIGNYTGTLDRTLNLTVTALAINSITYTAINTETSTALTAAAVPTVDPAEAATGALFDIDTGFTTETGLSFDTGTGAISGTASAVIDKSYTVSITGGDGTKYEGSTQSTSIQVKVTLSDTDAVADALSALDITAAVGGNLQAVTSSFTLPTAGEEGTSISWEVLSGSAITLSGSNNENAAVTRPSFTAADDDVLIKATVTKNGETDTKTFSLKVLKASNLSDAESVAQAKADLDITELGFVSGDTFDSVTQDFTLPTTGSEGTTISWEVVSGSAIDLSGSNNEDAAVTRPSFTATDDDVVLKATFTKNGETDSNTFNLKVLKADSLSDTESVTQAKDDLDIAGLGFALGDTFDSVTQDFTLPTTGSEGTTISWEVVSGSGISLSGSSNKDASVSRPNYMDGDSNVKLRATYSKNGATASEEFDLTVLKKDQIPLTASLTGSISPITIPAGSDSTKTLSFTGASQSLIIGTDIEVRIKTRPNTAAEAHLSLGVNTGVLFPSTDIIPRDGGDYIIELSGIGNYTGTLDRTLNLTVTALGINSITYTAINTETSTALTAAAVPTVDPAEAATGALFDIDTGFTTETGLSFDTGTGAISGTASAVIDKSYTVSITGGDGTKYEGSTQSTSIQVKVTLSDADAVADALSALDITAAVGGNLQAVTSSFTLPTAGEEGTSISWEVLSGSAITLSGSNNENAAVTRPSFTAADDDVLIKATVTKNGETDTKTFSLKVLKASSLSDAESVAQAKADLDITELGFVSGDTFDSVTQDFTLPTTGSEGTTISWEVVSGSAIDLSGSNNEDAAVTRPSFTATDDDVVLKATFTKNGETDSNTFNLKVLKADSLSDTESVTQAKDDLDIAGLGFALGDTFDSVTQDFTLPTTGSEGTTISWEVVNGSGISLSGSSNKDASVSRPNYMDGDSNVKLRATYSKNGATASEEFDLTVLKKDQVPLTASLTGSISPITIPAGSDSTKTLSFTGASQSLIIGTDIEVRIKTRPNTAAEAHLSMGVNTGVLFPSTDIIPRDSGDYIIELSGIGNYTGTLDRTLNLTVTALGINSITYTAINTETSTALTAAATPTVDPSEAATGALFDIDTDFTTETGLSFNTGTGAISGTASAVIDKSYTVSITGGDGTKYEGSTQSTSIQVRVTLSDADAVARAKNDLEATGLGFAGSDTWDGITQDFTLPVSIGTDGVTISWEVVSGSGIVLSGNSNQDASVSRPDYTDGDSNVKLRATYSKNGATASEEFDLTVLKKDQVPLTASLTGSISPITITAGSDNTETLSFTGASQSLIIGTDIEVRIKTRPNTAAEAHLSMGLSTGVLFPSTDIIPRDGGDYIIEFSGIGNYTGTLDRTLSLTVTALPINSISYTAINAETSTALTVAAAPTVDPAEAAAAALFDIDTVFTAETGLSFNTGTGAISGTASAVIDKSYTVSITGGDGTKYEGSTQSTSIQVRVTLSDADSVAAAKAALVITDITFASGEDKDSVTQDVTLPASGEEATTIAWSSDNTAIDATGTVTRPSASSSDATVTLTATISKGSASDTKTFVLTVLKEEPIDIGTLGSFTIDVDAATAKTNTESSHSATVNGGLTAGIDYTLTITDPLTITNGGVITIPDTYTSVGTHTITVTAVGTGNYSGTKAATFTLTVGYSDAELVAQAKTDLAITYAVGDSASAVTQDLTLPTTGTGGTTIAWSSNNTAVITAAGVVTRPSAASSSTLAILTATISKGSASDTKTFVLTVLKEEPIDIGTLGSFTITVANKTVETNSTSTDTHSVTIGGGLAAVTDYTLGITAPLVITDAGAISIFPNSYTSVGTHTITVTATGRGNYTGTKTATFTLTVVLSDADAVAAAKTALDITDITFAAGEDASKVIQDITLPTAGTDGTSITWSSNYAAIAVAGTDGTVTRPDASSNDVSVTLTATITKDSATATKDFTLTVIKMQIGDMFSYVDVPEGAVSINNALSNYGVTITEGTHDNIKSSWLALVDPKDEQASLKVGTATMTEGGVWDLVDNTADGVFLEYTFSRPVSVRSLLIAPRTESFAVRIERVSIALYDDNDNVLMRFDNGNPSTTLTQNPAGAIWTATGDIDNDNYAGYKHDLTNPIGGVYTLKVLLNKDITATDSTEYVQFNYFNVGLEF